MTSKKRMAALRKIITICHIKTPHPRVPGGREQWYRERHRLRLLRKRSPTHYDFLWFQEAYCLKPEEVYVTRRILDRRLSTGVDAIFIPSPVHPLP